PIAQQSVNAMKPEFDVSHDDQITTILDGGTNRNFPTKKYSKGTRLLNFHSWRPYYDDPEFTFSLYGENILNTLQTEIYYLYNQNDKTNSSGLNMTFAQWFPYLSV